MYRILSEITTIANHLSVMRNDPEVYRPKRCPDCGFGKLWGHGCYFRKADRGEGTLNPIPIARWRCGKCRQTCSRLPLCIAPRRWFNWSVQGAVLVWVLSGCSHNAAAHMAGISRHTVTRWWTWLERRGEEFAFFLRNRFPEWGRTPDPRAFWHLAFGNMPLAEIMACLDRDIAVP